MTRKDYVLIAVSLAAVRPRPSDVNGSPDWASEHMGRVLQWRTDRAVIANALEADNPRFDRVRFYAATEQ